MSLGESKNRKNRLQGISAKPKMIIEPKAFDRIKELCAKINTIEWSGILFYTLEGRVSDPSNIIVRVKDLYLMDIGNSSYTEFLYDSDHLQYMYDNFDMENESILKGLIHSHHNMKAYFSGTDNDELAENAPNHNLYVSLIVNNLQNNVARLAVSTYSEGKIVKNHTYRESTGEVVQIQIQEDVDKVLVLYYDFDIEQPENIPSELDLRIAEIKSKKAAVPAVNIGGKIVPTEPKSFMATIFDEEDQAQEVLAEVMGETEFLINSTLETLYGADMNIEDLGLHLGKVLNIKGPSHYKSEVSNVVSQIKGVILANKDLYEVYGYSIRDAYEVTSKIFEGYSLFIVVDGEDLLMQISKEFKKFYATGEDNTSKTESNKI